jgi:uncharacterized membrane protein
VLTRGLWLIVLEFTVVRLMAFFSLSPKLLVMLQVIWVIGVSMIVLAPLIHLPLKVIAGFGLGMIFLHNLLDKIQVAGGGPGSPGPDAGGKLWMVLHQQGLFRIAGADSPIVLVLYPLIPWIGVMAAGYAFGALYQKEVSSRRRLLLGIGGLAVALFFIIRAIDVYGEPLKWARQKNIVFTVLSFLNTTKYPPSLLFLLMTLGPALIALAYLENFNFSAKNPLIVFGRVPFFFFLFHIAFAHLLYVAINAIHYGWHSYLLLAPPTFGSPLQLFPPGFGYSLPVTYLVWITVVLFAYPLCRWHANLKQRRRDLWWLSYL